MQHRNAIAALITAGTIWGATVALSKLTMHWLDPSWLTTLRFAFAAPALALFSRRGLRAAINLRVLGSGALGFGATMLLQNAGIATTSVSHAAIIVGALPVIVALITAGLGHARPSRLAWAGYAVALVGIVMVAGGGGGGATVSGDLLVFASVALSAVFISLQPQVLRGQEVAAVTTVQFAAGALISLPVSLLTSGAPPVPTSAGPAVTFIVLVLVGTVLPFWLFAYGQAHVSADLAGVFVNVEPLVGAAVGWVAFGDPVGPWQLIGVATAVTGMLLSALPSQSLVDSAEPRWA